MKKVLMAIGVLFFIAGCSKGVTTEKYVSVMVDMGCKGGIVDEASPEAAKVFAEKGVKLEEVQKFRKKAKPAEMAKAAVAIARQVAACHGVNLE